MGIISKALKAMSDNDRAPHVIAKRDQAGAMKRDALAEEAERKTELDAEYGEGKW